MADAFALTPVVFLLIIAIPLAAIDLQQHRLPNRFTYSAILISLLGTLGAAAISGNWEAFLVGTVTNIAMTGMALLACFRSGLGMGDVKLLVAMNQSLAFFSPWLVLISLLIAVTTATLVSLSKVALKTLSFRDRIAFGPFLLLGYAVSAAPELLGTSLY